MGVDRNRASSAHSWLVSGGLNMNGGYSSWDAMYEGVLGVWKTTPSCSSSTSERTASTIIGNGERTSRTRSKAFSSTHPRFKQFFSFLHFQLHAKSGGTRLTCRCQFQASFGVWRACWHPIESSLASSGTRPSLFHDLQLRFLERSSHFFFVLA